MDKKRMFREMFIRVGITSIVVGIATLFLHAVIWLWAFPAFIGLMVWLRYRTGEVD